MMDSCLLFDKTTIVFGTKWQSCFSIFAVEQKHFFYGRLQQKKDL